jgi:hypothetical protein
MKPTSTFKMNKQTKRFLATVIDSHRRGELKRMSIQAQLVGALQPRREKSNKNDSID